MSRAADRRRPSSRGALALLGGVLVGLVAGCGPQGHEAGPSPVGVTTTAAVEPAPSPTPSSTPSSVYDAPADAYVEPVRPAALDGKPSEDAAIAFARYYLQMYTYAYLTGDADGLNALGKAGCVFCKNVKDDLGSDGPAGGHGEGGVITVGKVDAHDYTVDGGYRVTLSARQAPNRQFDSAGKIVADHPDVYRFSAMFVLTWTKSDGWRVGGVAVEPA